MMDSQPCMQGDSLAGQHAVVTGGGHGLGATIASALAKAGAAVTIMGRDHTRLSEAAAILAADGATQVSPIPCDVSEPESVAAAFARATERLGAVNILVNNAGQARSAPFTDTSLELWQSTIDVNLTGAFLCSQQVIAHMVSARDGRVINVASTAALRGYSTLSAYCASKHGLLGLTRSMAAEFAQFQLTVNAVCPGYTEGGMSDQAINAIMLLRNVSADEALQRLVRHSPSGRLTTQDEVAGTVTWLCSRDAAAITGQAIAVAGGEVM
ncbi:MAG: SDR family oxidoreductase [Gemmatimonadaceae bacterium]